MTEKLSPPEDRDFSKLSDHETWKQVKKLDEEHANLVPLSEEDYPVVHGDKRRLMQVLLNLIKNALKFTRAGSINVALAYDIDNQMLVGHVRDTGVGIAKRDQAKLFSRFGKLLRTAEMNHEGIGLGLTIVKEIVNRCDGLIDMFSNGEGQGCTFRFSMRMEAPDKQVEGI